MRSFVIKYVVLNFFSILMVALVKAENISVGSQYNSNEFDTLSPDIFVNFSNDRLGLGYNLGLVTDGSDLHPTISGTFESSTPNGPNTLLSLDLIGFERVQGQLGYKFKLSEEYSVTTSFVIGTEVHPKDTSGLYTGFRVSLGYSFQDAFSELVGNNSNHDITSASTAREETTMKSDKYFVSGSNEFEETSAKHSLKAGVEPKLSCFSNVKVEQGDTLYSLSSSLRVHYLSLIYFNLQIKSGFSEDIKAGDIIRYPVLNTGCNFYLLVKGDSIYSVGERFGDYGADKIKAQLQGKDENLVYPNQVIRVTE